MRKFFIALCAIALLASCGKAPQEQTAADADSTAADSCLSAPVSVEIFNDALDADEWLRIEAPVKQAEVRYYGLGGSKDTADKVLFSISRYTYDASGRILSWTTLFADGSLNHRYTYRYNAEGQLLSRLEENADNETDSVAYTYADGLLAEMSVCLSDGRSERTAYAYDDAGHLLRRTSYDATGALWDRTDFACDAEGRTLSETAYFPGKEKVMHTIDYQYSPDGLLLKQCRRGSADSTVYRYDADDRKLARTSYYDGEVECDAAYQYDDAGRLLSERDLVFGDTSFLSDYAYDDRGVLTRLYQFVSMEEGEGNWTLLEIDATLWE